MTTPPLRRIVAFRLVTQQPDTLARFYAEALGAGIVGVDALGGSEAGERTRLAIGEQRIDLDAFADAGAPYPQDLGADDQRFQHFAFVVADIAAMHDRARACGATAISRGGPVTLPASAGGVTAVKLRDPEGHPFELLHVPAGGQSAWSRIRPNARGVIGVDHSAIVVDDAAASTAFYAQHGLVAAGAGVNRGPTQAALDGLASPVVDVVPLHPAAAEPHLELLGYHGRRGRGPAVGAHDVAATRIVWVSDRDTLLVDPNGHRHVLVSG